MKITLFESNLHFQRLKNRPALMLPLYKRLPNFKPQNLDMQGRQDKQAKQKFNEVRGKLLGILGRLERISSTISESQKRSDLFSKIIEDFKSKSDNTVLQNTIASIKVLDLLGENGFTQATIHHGNLKHKQIFLD